jgi:hypothetical protein
MGETSPSSIDDLSSRLVGAYHPWGGGTMVVVVTAGSIAEKRVTSAMLKRDGSSWSLGNHPVASLGP